MPDLLQKSAFFMGCANGNYLGDCAKKKPRQKMEGTEKVLVKNCRIKH
jgi:hypothetical protein